MPPANRPVRQRRPAADKNENSTPAAVAVPVYTAHEPSAGIERIGDILRHRRQQRGDDLQQIADYLCIRRSFLVAIENSAYDELPADAYVIGFLRSYAALLGFDGNDAINRYRGEMAGRRRKPVLVLPTPITEGRTPSTFIMIGAAIAALLIYALWYGFSASSRTSVNAQLPLPPVPLAAPTATNNTTAAAAPITGGIALASPPPTEPISVAPQTGNTQAALAAISAASTIKSQDLTIPAAIPQVITPAPVAAAVPIAGRLAIRAEKESWVVVADSKGHTILDKVMKPGDIFPLPDMEGLKLTTGNSGGIVLVLDGKDLPKLSRDSSILHDIPLDTDKLKLGKSKAVVHE